jgi:hypothetical protein
VYEESLRSILNRRASLLSGYTVVGFGIKKEARKMASQPLPLSPLCSLCHKPVELKTSKTDENGHAVHEECYLAKLKIAIEGTPPKP